MKELERLRSENLDIRVRNQELLSTIGKLSAEIVENKRNISMLKDDLEEAYDEIRSLLRQLEARNAQVIRQNKVIAMLREER